MRAALVLALALGACAPDPTPEPAPGLRARADSVVVVEPERRFTARVGYPQVEGDGPLSDRLAAVNAVVRDSVEAFVAAFRPEAPPPGDPPADSPVRVEGGFGRAFLSGDAFSALVEVDAYTGGAHGNTFFQPVTVAVETGRGLDLGDLFRPDAPWGDTLAAYVERGVVAAIARGLGAPHAEAHRLLYAAGLDDVRRGRAHVTLGPDSLYVHVPPYQLAAYAAGSFHVGVPRAALAPFAQPGGPLETRAAGGRPPR